MSTPIKIIVFTVLLSTGFIVPDYSRAQSLNGATGLIIIPTARMQQDGALNIGASYFEKRNQEYMEGKYDFVSAYLNFTFLPFLELGIRLNKPLDYHEMDYIVDRVPLLRLRLLREGKLLPAVAVGIHDFASTSTWETVHFNATYVVLSKKISDFDFHLGYAPRIMKAEYYQLDGLFGGVSYTLHRNFDLYGEYDSKNINVGFQYRLVRHFAINLAAINFNSYALGINFQAKL